jgi:hypothetical protein
MKVLLAVLLLASSAFAQDKVAAANAMGSCGPRNVEFKVENDKRAHSAGTAEPGKALVYIIENQGSCAGCQVTTKVGVDGAWIGANRGDSYLSLSIDPGERHICASWQSSRAEMSSLFAFTNFTAEAGKVYYFRVRVVAGRYEQAWMDVDAINPDEGRFLISSSSLSSSHPKP